MTDRRHLKRIFEGKTKVKFLDELLSFFKKHCYKILVTHYGNIISIVLIYLSLTIVVITV